MAKKAAIKKLGRPKLPGGRATVRQIGRIHDDQWEYWQLGFEESGFTSWTDWMKHLIDAECAKLVDAKKRKV